MGFRANRTLYSLFFFGFYFLRILWTEFLQARRAKAV